MVKASEVVAMNQPEVRNALTGNTAADDFVAACAQISADTSERAVILTGAGSAFCLGRLLREGQNTRAASLLEMSAAFQAIAHKTKQHRQAVEAFIGKRQPNCADY